MSFGVKRSIKRMIASCITVLMLLSVIDYTNLVAYAYEEKTGMIYSTDKSMVETKVEPSSTAKKANGLLYGKPVTVVDETKDIDGALWYKLTYKLKAGGTATGYCLSTNVLLDKDAEKYATGKVNTNNVSLRDDAGTDRTTILASLSSGHAVELLDGTTVDGNQWHRVRTKVNGTTYIGWIYGTYVTIDIEDVETDEDYEKALLAKGFPKSYVKSLAVLHEKYPNWEFEPVITGLNWDTVIEKESRAAINMVPVSDNDAKKSVAASEYDWETNKWVIRDGSGWVTAHPDYIAYCMDPRNFLDETYVFQFESLSYNKSQNLAGVSAILKGNFMANDVVDTDGTTLNYAKSFYKIGKEVGVSPYHLASRVRQEQGSGNSPLISGNYSDEFKNVFNYFNIKAAGTPREVLIRNGLTYAKNQGWTTRYLSLLGGSKFIAEKYILRGQDTLYFQKFNVVYKPSLYGHQYMGNVTAAITEGKQVSKGYTDKSQAFVFRIPVYENMPEKPVSFTASGNRNNYLSKIDVSGLSLTPTFKGATTKYSIIVDSGVASITVAATPVVSKSTVSGTGTYKLKEGTNTIKVKCKSESGDTRTYTLSVVRQTVDEENPETEYTLVSEEYVIGKYITGIEPSTTAKTLLKGITCEGAKLKVLKSSGEEKTGKLATGDKIAVYANDTLVATKTIVIYGDVNGDAAVDVLDIIRANRHVLDISPLKGAYLEAGDANRKGDGVDVLDIIVTNRHTLGLTTIQQK